MKAEINNENRAKFFAQYWGQDVLTVGNALCENLPENWIESSLNHTQYLQLKPLSEISDEDAIDVAKINTSIHWNNGLTPNVWKNSFGHTIVSNGTGIIDKYGQTIISEHYLSYTQVDFLRSRGYLVPWMGLSCEEIIEAGWAKLKKSEKVVGY